jgi:hypothetical protein
MMKWRTVIAAAVAIAVICVVGHYEARPPVNPGEPPEAGTRENTGQLGGPAAMPPPPPTSPEDIDRLARAVQDKDANVACQALRKIAATWKPGQELPPAVVEILCRALADPRRPVAAAAAAALMTTHPPLPGHPPTPEELRRFFPRHPRNREGDFPWRRDRRRYPLEPYQR